MHIVLIDSKLLSIHIHNPFDLSCIHFKTLCRCGDDLVTLFKSSAVQNYFNNTSSHSTQSQKLIYQPGTVRKVNV